MSCCALIRMYMRTLGYGCLAQAWGSLDESLFSPRDVKYDDAVPIGDDGNEGTVMDVYMPYMTLQVASDIAEEIISRLKRHGILKWKQIAVIMSDYVYRVNAYLWNHKASIATCFQWTLNANTELGLSASLGRKDEDSTDSDSSDEAEDDSGSESDDESDSSSSDDDSDSGAPGPSKKRKRSKKDSKKDSKSSKKQKREKERKTSSDGRKKDPNGC